MYGRGHEATFTMTLTGGFLRLSVHDDALGGPPAYQEGSDIESGCDVLFVVLLANALASGARVTRVPRCGAALPSGAVDCVTVGLSGRWSVMGKRQSGQWFVFVDRVVVAERPK